MDASLQEFMMQVPCTCGPSSIRFQNRLMLLGVTYAARQERDAGIKKIYHFLSLFSGSQ